MDQPSGHEIHEDSDGEFCRAESIFSKKKVVRIYEQLKPIKLLLTELVGQCRIILFSVISAQVSCVITFLHLYYELCVSYFHKL